MRAVFDAAILVRAHENANGPARAARRRITSPTHRLISIAEIIDPKVTEPVIVKDPKDDAVLYTAVVGKADVLCALDRYFYDPAVLQFCRMRNIRVMNDVDLLLLLDRGGSQ